MESGSKPIQKTQNLNFIATFGQTYFPCTFGSIPQDEKGRTFGIDPKRPCAKWSDPTTARTNMQVVRVKLAEDGDEGSFFA